MSSANIEVLEGLFAAADSLDRDATLAALPQLIAQVCDPEIEWIEDPNRADGKIYHGHDGVRESWERWLENFDEYAWEIESIREHGDRVLVVAVEHGRGSTSGVDVSGRIYMICTFRAGKIVRYEEFSQEADARATLEP